MTETPFLKRLALHLLQADNISNTTVVLPNRRARVFLVKELQALSFQTFFAPDIISVEDLVTEMASLRQADPIETLFEFYEVYLQLTDAGERQGFEQFANWGKVILQDFNEIDRYLLDPDYVLSYLTAVERMKNWSPDGGKPTPLVEKYLHFWNQLPQYYQVLNERLKLHGKGYQGMIYREAVANLEHFVSASAQRRFVFAGLNALNAAEERIVKQFLSLGIAEIFWDADRTFIEDDMHDAGLFLRKYKESWSWYNGNNFYWISEVFAEEKTIEIIGTPKSVGQARIAGRKIEEIILQKGSEYLSQTALILGEENLLLPVLNSLPAEVGALNITMGYPARNSPPQILLLKLFKLHLGALKRESASYVMYYKDVVDVVTHPLVEPYVESEHLLRIINHDNYSFITHARLMDLAGENSPLFHLVFEKWETLPSTVLGQLSMILLEIKSLLGDREEDKIAKAFLYAVFKVINKLETFFSKYEGLANLDTLHSMYRQVVDMAEVSFEGEPLQGLQLMGVLESRALDFETVIITSMNEGRFPAGKSHVSFIPYDVKREVNLPTFKEKDAIYTYHFYRILQRAKHVILLYNTDNEGLDGGEKSRFITQLEVERQPNHQITHTILNPEVPQVAREAVVIPKSDKVMARLKQIAESGFYPTNLTTYIRDPLLFYHRKVLQIRDVDEVEENIALNTLGTIIHEALKVLYMPFIGKTVYPGDIESMMTRIDGEVLNQFRAVYKMGEIKKGKNLLAFEVAKRNIRNFLRAEHESLKKGEVLEIIALEETFERVFEHPSLPFPVMIKGNVDRIERRDGKVRIIDYKTGRVEERDMCLKQWDGLTSDIKHEKLVQVLAYAFICKPKFVEEPLECGIISFKNMKCGFMPLTIKDESVTTSTMTDEIVASYLTELAGLLAKILDPEEPFVEKLT